jgi:hypothetical protein
MQRRLDIILSRLEGIERALKPEEAVAAERPDKDGNVKMHDYDEHATSVK